MYQKHLDLCRRHFPMDFALECIERIHSTDRWFSFDRFHETCRTVEGIMRDIGMEDVETITWPADGVTDYGGWMMPLAWDAREATLEVVGPTAAAETVCRYTDVPCCLMNASGNTPPEGVAGPLRILSVADIQDASLEAFAGHFLLFRDGRPSLRQVAELFETGVIGILCGPVRPQSPGTSEDLVGWHNLTIPPWKIPQRGVGFSLSASQIRPLSSLASSGEGITLKATVDATLYEGELPLVTGVLKGETDEEVAWSCHLFEQGANDNASGVAAGLALVKMIQDLVLSGEGRLPRRGIRLVFTHEVRSLQAFANTRRFEDLVAGLNPDMIGTPEGDSFCVSTVNSDDVQPNYAAAFLRRLIAEGVELGPIRHASRLGGSDNVFADPAIGVPCPTVIANDFSYWHSSMDTIDSLSKDVFHRLGAAAGAYCWFLADAAEDEALWLAQLTDEDRRNSFLALCEELRSEDVSPECARDRIDFHIYASQQAIRSVLPLAPKTVKAEAARMAGELADFCRAQRESDRSASVPADDKGLAERVPVRAYQGFFSLEKYLLDDSIPAVLRPVSGWSAPRWLNAMLFWSNGKRTLADIHRMLRGAGMEVSAEALKETYDFLLAEGYITSRPVVRTADVAKALRALGVKPGDMLFAHTSLSWPGYVADGPATVIDALLEVVGPEGTVALPTFTFTSFSSPPFDRENSPSRVGAISEAFRLRPDAVRSGHPTHSVAAVGKKAAWLVECHPVEENPFAEGSPFEKLYREDATVLMLCRHRPNTCMHVGELLADAEIPRNHQTHLIENGERRVVTIESTPHHTTAFDRMYELLRERGQIREIMLGENPVLAMKARDVIDVSVEVMRDDPLAVVQPGCECDFCARHRGKREAT